MEEDIKILEEYLRIYKEINEKYDNYFVSIKEIPIPALENLLKRYKELEEENKELKIQCQNEFNRGFFMKVAENYEKTNAEIINVPSLYVPKSVIEDKINEYLNFDNEHKTYTKDGRANFTMEYFKALGLLELLEERNK